MPTQDLCKDFSELIIEKSSIKNTAESPLKSLCNDIKNININSKESYCCKENVKEIIQCNLCKIKYCSMCEIMNMAYCDECYDLTCILCCLDPNNINECEQCEKKICKNCTSYHECIEMEMECD